MSRRYTIEQQEINTISSTDTSFTDISLADKSGYGPWKKKWAKKIVFASEILKISGLFGQRLLLFMVIICSWVHVIPGEVFAQHAYI
jgi:hypothetical protein